MSDCETTILPVPTNDELRNPWLVHRLANILVDLGMSRRELANFTADALFDQRYVFVWRGSDIRFQAFEDEIDRAFNDDGSFRWISSLMLQAFKPVTATTQMPQFRILHRLRLIVMALTVRYPEEARTLFL